MTIDNSIGFYPSLSHISPAWTWSVAATLQPRPQPGYELYSEIFGVAALSNRYTPLYPGMEWSLGYVFTYWWTMEDPPGAFVAGYLDARFPDGTGTWKTIHTLDAGDPVDAWWEQMTPFFMVRLPCAVQYRMVLVNSHATETRWVQGAFSVHTR